MSLAGTLVSCGRCAELEGKLSAALQRVTELQIKVDELEARLKQNSSNSSKPPSSDPPSAPVRQSKAPTGRKRGGQPGQRVRLPAERVNRIVDHIPGTCQHCQTSLSSDP